MDGWGAFPLQKKKKKVHPRETKRNNQPWRRTDAHDARALARAASPIRQAHPPTAAPPRHRRPNTTVVGLSFLPSHLPPLPTRSARPLAWREEPRRETRPIQPPIAARARDAPPRAPTSDKRRGGTPRPAAGTMASAGSRRPLSSTPHPRHRREFSAVPQSRHPSKHPEGGGRGAGEDSLGRADGRTTMGRHVSPDRSPKAPRKPAPISARYVYLRLPISRQTLSAISTRPDFVKFLRKTLIYL